MLLSFCADLPPAWNAAHEKLSTARTLILPSGFACSTANRGHIKHKDRLSSFICRGGVILHFCASSLVSSMSLSDSASSRSSFTRTSFHAAMSFCSAFGHLASLASIGVPMPLRTKGPTMSAPSRSILTQATSRYFVACRSCSKRWGLALPATARTPTSHPSNHPYSAMIEGECFSRSTLQAAHLTDTRVSHERVSPLQMSNISSRSILTCFVERSAVQRSAWRNKRK